MQSAIIAVNLRRTLESGREIMNKEILNDWIRNIRNEDDRAELETVMSDDSVLNERFSSELQFGTGGLRGIVGIGTNCMNIYTVGRASKGLAAYMRAHGMEKVAISYDSRRKSRLFAETAARIFAGRGILSDYGCRGCGSGAVYRERKLFRRGKSFLRRICAARDDLFCRRGDGREISAGDTEYRRKTDLSGLKIAYSALNGTGYRLVPELLEGAGAEVARLSMTF